jgi:hypothetical protein
LGLPRDHHAGNVPRLWPSFPDDVHRFRIHLAENFLGEERSSQSLTLDDLRFLFAK